MKNVTNILFGIVFAITSLNAAGDGVYTIGQLRQDGLSLQNASRYDGQLSGDHREVLGKMVGYVTGSAEQYVLQTGCTVDPQYASYYNLVDLVARVAGKMDSQYDNVSSSVLVWSVMRNVCTVRGEI